MRFRKYKVVLARMVSISLLCDNIKAKILYTVCKVMMMMIIIMSFRTVHVTNSEETARTGCRYSAPKPYGDLRRLLLIL